MGAHNTQVKRSGEGVIGTCSCRKKQLNPVPTMQEAEDWIAEHLREVVRIQCQLAKQLTPAQWLKFLREREEDTRRSRKERDQWKMLADEAEKRLKSAKSPYDTGVETEPLW